MSEHFDLLEYGLAKEICKDLPKVLEIFEKFKKELEPYKKYRDVGMVLDLLTDSAVMTQLQLGIYQQALKNRGKVE